MLVVVTTVLSNLVGEFWVGPERVLGNVSFDGVARVSGESVIHVAKLTVAVECFILIVTTWNATRVLLHVNICTARSRQMAAERLRPVDISR